MKLYELEKRIREAIASIGGHLPIAYIDLSDPDAEWIIEITGESPKTYKIAIHN